MILTINKNGEITQRNIKNYENLYSICNYRNNNNFELLYQDMKIIIKCHCQ